ncbi:MAG: ABC transporter ATP-binding protein [Oscillospiraceae bacterium]|jgi:ABC-2 type transport system ATP-binding protein|nr:ABC transporter ATP-binding protein [Oscillospiraceae bacterium]
MVEINDLVKKYGNKTALDHVSFQVREGEVLGFLGPNGAGKSTTLNILTGNLSATSGTASIDGFEILESPLEAKRRLGYLPEQPPLYPEMTVEEYLTFVYRLKRCRLERKAHLEEVCRTVDIQDVRPRLIRNLSKGYRQRLGIAQALVGRPRALVLDEPASGLDPKQMEEVRDLVKSLGRERTVIFSSHNLAEVQAVCDRVVVIDHGRVVADGAPEELARRLGGTRLRVRAEGTESALRERLERVPGVKAVRVLPAAEGECALELLAEDGRDIRRETALALKEGPFLALEITGADLQGIFLRLTEGERI